MAKRTAKMTAKMTAKGLEGLLAGECRHGRDPAFDVVGESWLREQPNLVTC